MSEREDLEQVELLVKPGYHGLAHWAHGWVHIRHVVENAKNLAQMEGANQFLCQVAAYCHDLGRKIEEEKGQFNPIPGAPGHAGFSVAPTQAILQKVGIFGVDAEKVIEAVKFHQLRKYFGSNEVVLILQDADRKDGLGKWGVARAMNYNCEMEFPQPSETELEKAIEVNLARIRENAELKERFVRVMNFTLDWYRELLNTESAHEYLKTDFKYSEKTLERVLS